MSLLVIPTAPSWLDVQVTWLLTVAALRFSFLSGTSKLFSWIISGWKLARNTPWLHLPGVLHDFTYQEHSMTSLDSSAAKWYRKRTKVVFIHAHGFMSVKCRYHASDGSGLAWRRRDAVAVRLLDESGRGTLLRTSNWRLVLLTCATARWGVVTNGRQVCFRLTHCTIVVLIILQISLQVWRAEQRTDSRSDGLNKEQIPGLTGWTKNRFYQVWQDGWRTTSRSNRMDGEQLPGLTGWMESCLI